MQYIDTWNVPGRERAERLSVPVVMSEFNSVSCGGSDISDTVSPPGFSLLSTSTKKKQFVMSLWSADVGLKAASLNYAAVHLHTRESGIKYNLFDPPTSESSTEPNWRTGSPYYGALFLSEIMSPNGSIVADLNLNNSITNQFSKVAAYGVHNRNGTVSKLAVFNYASGEQSFRILPGVAKKLYYRVLTAPSLQEKVEISWAGQTVRLNGQLEGNQVTETVDCQDGCVLKAPGPAALLVAIDDAHKELFTGNSTITSIGSYSNDSLHSSPRFGFVSLLISSLIFLGLFFGF